MKKPRLLRILIWITIGMVVFQFFAGELFIPDNSFMIPSNVVRTQVVVEVIGLFLASYFMRISNPYSRFTVIGISILLIPHLVYFEHYVPIAWAVGTIIAMFWNPIKQYYLSSEKLKTDTKPFIFQLLISIVFSSAIVLWLESWNYFSINYMNSFVYETDYRRVEFFQIIIPFVVGVLLLIRKPVIRFAIIGVSTFSIPFYFLTEGYYEIILMSGVLGIMFLKPIKMYFQRSKELQVKK